MGLAKVYLVSNEGIIDAVVALWRRGELSEELFMKCVAFWKLKNLVPVDWVPKEEVLINEEGREEL